MRACLEDVCGACMRVQAHARGCVHTSAGGPVHPPVPRWSEPRGGGTCHSLGESGRTSRRRQHSVGSTQGRFPGQKGIGGILGGGLLCAEHRGPLWLKPLPCGQRGGLISVPWSVGSHPGLRPGAQPLLREREEAAEGGDSLPIFPSGGEAPTSAQPQQGPRVAVRWPSGGHAHGCPALPLPGRAAPLRSGSGKLMPAERVLRPEDPDVLQHVSAW